MSESDIFASEFQDFYISETSTSCRSITRCGKTRILSKGPSEVYPFTRKGVDQIQFWNGTRKSLWTIPDIFIIFVTDDTSCSIFISWYNSVSISITIVVSKLECKLTVALVSSTIVHISRTSETVRVESSKASSCSHTTSCTTTYTIVVTVPICSSTDDSSCSIVSVSCWIHVVATLCCGSDDFPVPVFLIVDDTSILDRGRELL